MERRVVTWTQRQLCEEGCRSCGGCSQPMETLGLIPHSTHLMQTWQETRTNVAFWNHPDQHPGPQSRMGISEEWIWKSQQKIPSNIKYSSPNFIREITEVQRGEVSDLRLHNWHRTGPGFSPSLSEARAWASDWPESLFVRLGLETASEVIQFNPLP